MPNERSPVLKVVAAGVWLSLVTAFYLYKELSQMTVAELFLTLTSLATTTVWVPLIYLMIYAVRPLIFLPATILTVLSGILFGFWLGLLYTIIGANVSASVAYAVGRFFSRPHRSGASLLSRFATVMRERPFFASLTMHLTFLPFDLVNYGSGLARMPYPRFLAGTFLGVLPGISTFVSVGASLDLNALLENGVSKDVVDGQLIMLSVGIFAVSVLLARLIKYFYARWFAVS